MSENLGRFLEGRCGNEAVSRERRLGNTKEHRSVAGGFLPFGEELFVLRAEACLEISSSGSRSESPGSVIRTLRIIWRTMHSMCFIGDGHALEAVHCLNFIHQMALDFFRALHAQNVVRIDGTVADLLAGADAVAFMHCKVTATRNEDGVFVFAVLMMIFWLLRSSLP